MLCCTEGPLPGVQVHVHVHYLTDRSPHPAMPPVCPTAVQVHCRQGPRRDTPAVLPAAALPRGGHLQGGGHSGTTLPPCFRTGVSNYPFNPLELSACQLCLVWTLLQFLSLLHFTWTTPDSPPEVKSLQTTLLVDVTPLRAPQ